MSSSGSAASMSTLSTSLLAAACTALVAALIFVAFALRRYLRAKRRRQSTASFGTATAAEQIVAAYGDGKPVDKVTVGPPRLHYAPDYAHNAQHDLKNMSLAQKTLVSMRQQGFLPKAFASPKIPDMALLSPRMAPPPWSMQGPPRSPMSPGLSELAMSPGPSILLKPTNYGARSTSPAFLSSPNPNDTPKQQDSKPEKATYQKKKKQTRSAVPSVLLRSLGISSDFLAPSSSSEMNRILSSPSSPTPLLAKQADSRSGSDAEDQSFTPILDLGIDFGNDPAFQKALELPNDYGFLSPVPPSPAGQEDPSSSMAALFMALSPVSAYSSPPPSAALIATPSLGMSLLPTPPPSAGLPLPPAGTLHEKPSNASLRSNSSLSQRSASPSLRSIRSAAAQKARSDQVSLNMPSSDGFEPLNSGAVKTGRESQSTLNKILGSIRKQPSGSSSVDLESGNSTLDSSTTRSYSSDALSHSSSRTSFDHSPSYASLGKANQAVDSIVPPVPELPTLAKIPANSTTSNAPSNTAHGRQSRKRASTLGALDIPTIVIPDLMHPRPAPSPEAVSKHEQPQIVTVQVQQSNLTNLRAHSTDCLSLKGNQSPVMGFDSPYHRALYPDPPLDDAHLSPGLPPGSPLLAQFSPKMLDTSPSVSPKPSFTESMKARFSLSRKSATSSPGLASQGNTPRLDALDQFPLPHSDLLKSAEQDKGLSPAPASQTGASPTILFNGEASEPTRPLRLRKPAASRSDNSPQLATSSLTPLGASPSPMMHSDQWALESPAFPSESVTPDLFSPLIAESENALTPKGERIDFSKFAEAKAQDEATEEIHSPQAVLSATEDSSESASRAATSAEDMSTPRPRVMSSFDFDLDYTSHRDSMVSVAASTISMASNSTCMSDSVGEDLELAADRRVKLLASVQQNLIKAQVKEAKRESKTAARIRLSHMHKSSSLKNIPEELNDGVRMLGLGLFEEEEEEELQDDKPSSGPPTPPLTPVDATAAAKVSKHAPSASTSSASSTSSIPISRTKQRMMKGSLAPIDINAANRSRASPSLLTPERPTRGDGSTPSPSLGLRKLNLASSSTIGDGSPMKRSDRPAFSPGLTAPLLSPSPAHVVGQNDRSGRYNEEGRASRSITYRHGGVLPTISSKSAFDSNRPGYASSELSHSESNMSMGSVASSLGSFSSRMGPFPSPVNNKIMGMRPMVAGRGMDARGHSASNSVFSTASTNSLSYGHSSSGSSTNSSSYHTGRLYYKTTELSTIEDKAALDHPERVELVSALAL